jgi:hypothetical protein
MGRPKKVANALETDAEAKRLGAAAERKRKALEQMAENQQLEAELLESGAAADMTPEDMAPSPESPRLVAILSESADGSFCVHKIDRGVASKVGQFPITEWPDAMDNVAREAGGGTFRITFRRPDGTTAGQQTQTFDPKFYRARNDAPAGMDPMMALMIESMKESKRDILEMMKMFMSGGQQGGLIKTASDLSAILPLFIPKQEKSVDPQTLMEMLKTGIELGREVKGEAEAPGGGSITERIVGHLVNALGKPLAAQVAATMLPGMTPGTRAATPKALTDPAAATAPAAPQITKTEEAPVDPSILKIKSHFLYKLYAPSILNAARNGDDAKEWAGQILERVPDSWDGMVYDLVSRPDVLEYLALFEPTVNQFQEWFKQLAESIKNSFEPAAPEATASVPEAPAPAEALTV